MKNKKGLSEVVGTVLIVLIVVAAVVVVWIAIRGLIGGALGPIQQGFDLVELEIVEGSVNYEQGALSMVVHWKSGQGNVSALKLLVEEQDGTTSTTGTAYPEGGFNQLEKRKFVFSVPETAIMQQVSIVPVFVDDEGQEYTGKSVKDSYTLPSAAYGIPGLVSYWPLDGNAKDEVSGTQASFIGDGVIPITGKSGSAYSFDGHSYSYIDTGVVLGDVFSETFTISFWANVNPTQYAGTYNRVMGDGNAVTGYGMSINLHNDGTGGDPDDMAIGFATSGGWSSTTLDWVNTGMDQWVYVTFVVADSSIAKAYVDGQYVQETAATDYSYRDYGTNFLIGADSYSYSANNFYTGDLDEVSVYNRELTADQIEYLYESSQ